MRNRKRHWIRHWILKRTVLGLAVAALVAPAAAQARVDEGTNGLANSPKVTTQVVSSSGFDWSDAGIGAGVGVGLAVLGAAALRGSRHLGRPQTA
jgi:hypothetical protein